MQILTLILVYFTSLTRIFRKLNFTVVCVLFTVSCVNAQEYHFTNYTVNDGLPSSETYITFQDSKGYLWVGTDRGISRFDGYAFKNYSHKDGLGDQTIFYIDEDKEGRIWFASLSCQLFYFENGSIFPAPANKSILKFTQARRDIPIGFVIDEQGRIHLTINNLGTLLINGDKVSLLRTVNQDPISEYLLDENENPLVVLNNRTRRVQFKRVTDHWDTIANVKTGHPGMARKSLLDDDQFWFTHPICHLHKYNRVGNEYVTKKFEHPIIAITKFNDDYLIGFENGGVHLFDKNLERIQHKAFNQLNNLSIANINKDSQGGYWLASLNNGLFYLSSDRFFSINHEAEVMSFTEDREGKVYYSLKNGEVYQIKDTANDQIQRIASYGKSNANSIHYNEDDKSLMVSGDRGLWKGPSLINEGYKGMILQSDGNQNLWLQSIEGFLRLGKKDELVKARLNKRIYSSCFIDQETILIGGSIHVYRYHIPSNKLIDLSLENELLNSRVVSIKKINNHKYLLGSRGKGLILLDGDKVEAISTDNGLSSDIINDVCLENERTIWVAMNTGIARIYLNGKGGHAIQNFSMNHGLTTNEIGSIWCADEHIYLGTKKGVIRFNPEVLQGEQTLIKTELTEITVNEQPLITNDTLLPYDENYMTFTFKGTSFNQKGKIPYRYKLSPIENKWNHTFNKVVRYPKLNPGKYTFQVEAQNGDHSWGTPATYYFTIDRPFWKRTWFIISVLLLISILIFCIVKRRIWLIKRKSRYENEIMKQRHKALIAQMNPHFLFNAMSSIQYYIMANEEENSIQYVSRFSRLIRKMLYSSRDEWIALTDELETIQLYFDIENMKLHGKMSLCVNTELMMSKDQILIPPMLIQPHIENAIKHGLEPKGGKGEIRVTLEENSKGLYCIVRDNGVGRVILNKGDVPVKHRSQAMTISEDRLRLFSKDYSITISDLKDDNGKAMGTEVKFKLPFKWKGNE